MGRPYGVPKTDVERIMDHYGVSREEAERGLKYGVYPLPPRGTAGGESMADNKKLNYVAGTAGGALLGACVAGPVGAVVGGVLGFIFGKVTCKEA